MDVDAVLARHPDVALVDELAHTNVPGSGRNAKRWQDVLELLNANINVISTVNVQHIESLADVVERISGVAIRERVPDAVIRRADQIELVDSSPEQLRRRMLHGNIYPPERARQALHGFFRTDTLAALRELTLRFLADEVDDELIERFAAGAASAEVGERVLVAVTPTAGAGTLLRRAARLAFRLNADLFAVHVRSADADRSGTADIAALRTLAGDLGAHWQQLDGDPVTAIMGYAQEHRVTQIVLGRSQRNRWQRLTSAGSTVRRLTRRATGSGIDIHIVARDHLPALLSSPAAASSPSWHRLSPPVAEDGQGRDAGHHGDDGQ
jgi:two-component system sensor histidine kinase KdpD